MNIPDARVYLLSGVPIDETYVNSIYFEDAMKQYDYFYSKKAFIFSKMSYIKMQNKSIRVNARADELRRCNYMMFQEYTTGNKYETKWFYAFITGIDYIAEETSEVHYDVDVIQTWMFEWEMLDCLIERTHPQTDRIGENIMDENLELGKEMVVNNPVQEFDLGATSVWVLTSRDVAGEVARPRFHRGIFSGLSSYSFSMPDEFDRLIAFLKNFEGQEGAIVSIYQAPTMFDSTDITPVSNRWRIKKPYNLIDGYEPRNNKLLTAPYRELLVCNNRGDSAVYNFEDFEEDGLQPEGYYSFIVSGVCAPDVEIMCYPYLYKNVVENYNYALPMTGFPQCSWVGDPFKAWLAQHGLGFASKIVSTGAAVGSTVGATVGSSVGAFEAGVGTWANAAATATGPALLTAGALLVAGGIALYTKKNQLDHTPPTVMGQARSSNLNYAIGKIKYSAYVMSIRREIAESIDSYFDRYGYAIKAIGTPILKARKHWTFIKTNGCNMRGKLPPADMGLIKQLFDRGITFWVNGEEVGNYSLDNRAGIRS